MSPKNLKASYICSENLAASFHLVFWNFDPPSSFYIHIHTHTHTNTDTHTHTHTLIYFVSIISKKKFMAQPKREKN